MIRSEFLCVFQYNNGGCPPQQREASTLRMLVSVPESQVVKRRGRIINCVNGRRAVSGVTPNRNLPI